MKTLVPRVTVTLADGSPACVICYRRPKQRGPNRYQSYCKECHAEDARRRREQQRRQGKKMTYLTPEERSLILELRTVEPAGKHHAAVSR